VDKKGKETMYDIEEKINFSVFPGLQVPTTLLAPSISGSGVYRADIRSFHLSAPAL
jgi:hypothetical protein